MNWSTKHKIVVFLSSTLVLLAIAFGSAIYYFILNYAYSDFKERLHIRAVTSAKINLDVHKDVDYLKEFKAEYLEKLLNEQNHFYALDTLKNFKILEKSLGLRSGFIDEVVQEGEAIHQKNAQFFSGVLYHSQGRNYIVIASAENYYVDHHVAYLRKMLLLLFLSFALVSYFVSYWFSVTLMTPLKNMIHRVEDIGMDNLHLRIEDTTVDSDLKKLGQAFNRMLDRLETSFEAQKNFVSNASHELKTPLTAIICEADLSLQRDRNKEEYKHALRAILEEAGKLAGKTKALLQLAQISYEEKKISFSDIRIDEALLQAKSTIDAMYADNKIKIDFLYYPDSSDQFKVRGNELLLQLGLSNILSNAIKYSQNKLVEVIFSWENTYVILYVKDRGIGIPHDEIPFVFTPYFRASNSLEFEGFGIGLALSQKIFNLHDGSLDIRNREEGGLSVKIKIPLGSY